MNGDDPQLRQEIKARRDAYPAGRDIVITHNNYGAGQGHPPPYIGPSGRPSPPAPPKKSNWAAVSALAAVAAVVFAFLVYAISSGASAPHQQPNTGILSTTTSPAFIFSNPASTQPSGPPVGCQRGEATVATWNQTAGSTWPSRQSAAQQAVSGMEAAINSGVTSEMVDSALVALNNDFTDLYEITMGDASSAYDTVVAKIGYDSQALTRDCDTG